MSIRLALLAASQGGVFTRSQALDCGISSDEVRRAVQRKESHRTRRGAYVDAVIWADADATERHVLCLRSVALLTAPPVVASHETAAAAQGLELWEPSYDWINITRPAHSGRREAGVWHHQASLDASEVITTSGSAVTGPLRTGLDLARRADFEHGVVALDSALRLSQASIEELQALHFRCVDWPGAIGAGRAVAFADGRSGSPGESRSRVHLVAGGVPTPLSQVSIYDGSGRLTGVVDFLVKDKTILEFDGRMKYALDGLDPEACPPGNGMRRSARTHFGDLVMSLSGSSGRISTARRALSSGFLPRWRELSALHPYAASSGRNRCGRPAREAAYGPCRSPSGHTDGSCGVSHVAWGSVPCRRRRGRDPDAPDTWSTGAPWGLRETGVRRPVLSPARPGRC